jgi:chemotaxis protein MotB
LSVETKSTGGGISEIGENGIEIVGEASAIGLQEILYGRVVRRKGAGKGALVHSKSAVVVEVHAEAAEIDDAVVTGDGIGDCREQSGLRFAERAVGFKRAPAGTVRVDLKLRVDVRDRGVVSYADFITLLFAFFVVLYASSQVDKRKVGKLALAIQVAFQQLGVFDTSNTQIPLNDSEAIPFSKVQVVENAERTADLERFVQPMKGILAPINSAPMKDIQAELEKALAPEIKKHVVDIKETREGLVVSLREMGFYESGSAFMKPSAQGAVDRLAAILGPRTESLRIEGHTDNVPIHNSRYASNWELSTARASELIKLFVQRYHFDPARLSAAGYGEYHPVASNDTATGRARNRRVDIVILNPPRIDFAQQQSSSNTPGPPSSH